MDALTPNAHAAYVMLIEMGYQPNQAAGILGNLMHESTDLVDPRAKQFSGGPGRGIAQWEGPRLKELHRYAAKGGMDPHALETQVKFIDYELKTTEDDAYAMLQKAKSPTEAAIAFMHYERPKNYNVRTPERGYGYNSRMENAMRVAELTGLMANPPRSPTESPYGMPSTWEGSPPGAVSSTQTAQPQTPPPTQGQYGGPNPNRYTEIWDQFYGSANSSDPKPTSSIVRALLGL